MHRYHDDEELNRAIAIVGLMFPQGVGCLQLGTYLVLIFADWFSTTLEIFIRRDFGAWYLSFGRVVTAALAYGLFCMAYIGYNPTVNATILLPLGGAMMVMLLSHYWRIFQRGRQQPAMRVHPYFFGSSRLFTLPFFSTERYRRVYRYAEPLLCWTVGWVLFLTISPPVGIWLIGSSMALSLTNRTIIRREERHIRDLEAAEIEAEYYAERFNPRHQTRDTPVATPHYAVNDQQRRKK